MHYIKILNYLILMDYIIKIDNREKDIIKILNERGYCTELENLDLGDFQFVDLFSKEPIIIIERKTYADLNSSIKDGRYKEQKERLIYSIKKSVRKIILLEGTDEDSRMHISEKILDGVITNTLIRDNIHIYKCKNKEETVLFLENIIMQLPKYYDDLKKEIINGEEKKYSNEHGCKTGKKSNLTPEICFRNMFMQISGISNTIATVFSEKYKNMENFITEMNKKTGNNKLEIIKLISGEKYGSNMRRIGEKSAEKIYMHIFNDGKIGQLDNVSSDNVSSDKISKDNVSKDNVSKKRVKKTVNLSLFSE